MDTRCISRLFALLTLLPVCQAVVGRLMGITIADVNRPTEHGATGSCKTVH